MMDCARKWHGAAPHLFLVAILVYVGLLMCTVPSDADDAAFEPEEVHMHPDDGPMSFSMRNVAAPVKSLFRGSTGYWYKDRRITVETTPPGGVVDLFYVRSGFQKRFEQAETPVVVVLPPRVEAGARDVLKIRAFREGYRQRTVNIPVKYKEDELVIDLEPLPNQLAGFSNRYFAGRATLAFLTQEALTHRVQEAEGGFAVILVQTALGDGVASALESSGNPLVKAIFAQQLGEDLMVSIELTDVARDGSIEHRTRDAYDAARELHSFSVDLVPVDRGAEAVARARAALERITTAAVSGCAASFDESLRSDLGIGNLNRALSPHGSFAGPYLRAAMRRLGEVTPGGRVEFTDGNSYDPTVPIELEMALTEAGAARGYLALLRAFARSVEAPEHANATLHSLVAPELDANDFATVMKSAEARESHCLASR